jgi:trehalose/maltose transport system permease protein
MTLQTAASPTEIAVPVKMEPSQLTRERLIWAWIFLAPMCLALLVVAGWPLARSIWFSFTDASTDHLNEGQFIGFANYYGTLTLDSGRTIRTGVLVDPEWWNAVWNTVRFALVSVACETVLGTAVALALNANFYGRGLVRAAILVPWAIPTIVSAKMWSWMLNDQFGIINDLFLRLGLISHKIAWTATDSTSMASVLAVDIWKTTPFMALLILAGLQLVPNDIYEAAQIDGVNPIKTFWKVTLPLVRPAIMVAVIFRFMDAMRIFDLVYVLTPNSSATKTMSVIAKENMFDFDKIATGSTMSTLLFLILLASIVLYLRLGRVDLSGEGGR